VKKRIYPYALAASLFLLVTACRQSAPDLRSQRIAAAERYIAGLYGSDPSVVDALASDDIVVSYPIFEKLYGTSALRGREAVKALAVRFGQKWANPKVAFDEAIFEGNTVVLVWSFRARNIAPLSTDEPTPNQEQSWGGITVIRFDEAGKILAEVGEESTPGPSQRLHDAGTHF